MYASSCEPSVSFPETCFTILLHESGIDSGATATHSIKKPAIVRAALAACTSNPLAVACTHSTSSEEVLHS